MFSEFNFYTFVQVIIFKSTNMKILFIPVLLTSAFLSCKKDNIKVCQKTVPTIAGIYKITKSESVAFSTGKAQDNTSGLTTCELSGTYELRSDNTAAYSETTNCNGSGNGTWGLTEGGILYTSFGSGSGGRISGTYIVSWDCINLVLITQYPSVLYNNRYTLTRL